MPQEPDTPCEAADDLLSDLRVLVLAAGKSTRIRSSAAGLPKPLLQIAGDTLLGWNLRWLASFGVRRVWVNLHYCPEAIIASIGDGARYGMSVEYAREPEILGTAGGWKNVARHWGDGTSLVVYGDNLMRFDLAAFLATHRRRRATATVALFDPQVHAHTSRAGGRASLDTSGRIAGFEEGAEEADAVTLINAGAYLLEPHVIDFVGDGFQDFGKDVMPQLARDGSLFPHVLESAGFCLGLDTPERLRRAESLVGSLPLRLT